MDRVNTFCNTGSSALTLSFTLLLLNSGFATVPGRGTYSLYVPNVIGVNEDAIGLGRYVIARY